MAFVSQNSSNRVAALDLYDNSNGKVAYRLSEMLEFPTEFTLPDGNPWKPCSDDDAEQPQFEGMVADTYHNALYLSQEPVGLWKINLQNPANQQE